MFKGEMLCGRVPQCLGYRLLPLCVPLLVTVSAYGPKAFTEGILFQLAIGGCWSCSARQRVRKKKRRECPESVLAMTYDPANCLPRSRPIARRTNRPSPWPMATV